MQTHQLFRLGTEEYDGLGNVLWHRHSQSRVNACNAPLTMHRHTHTHTFKTWCGLCTESVLPMSS